MEYYILKVYQNEIKKDSGLENRINGFEPKIKMFVIICFIVMIVGCIEVIVTLILFPKQLWSLLGGIFCLGAVLVLFWIDNKDQKEHMDKYIDTNKKRLEILENTLLNIFHINNREKLEELINIYQEYINKKNEEEKRRNHFIIVILSALAGILTISFENMGLMGISFANWIYLATFLLLFVAGGCIGIYTYKYFDSLKGKYEMMIKDIKELLLIKY